MSLREAGILLCVAHGFYQDRAFFIGLSLACLSPPKFSALTAVKEPLGLSNGDNHFAFGALHLHLLIMHARREGIKPPPSAPQASAAVLMMIRRKLGRPWVEHG
ncbi:hypothetical protein BSZ21_03495 [Bradyrhizobium canariense]|nr:hypothetical protein BSZ21_03495 [Bradyrhizobium canariense]